MNYSRPHEIAGTIRPLPSLPAAPARLPIGDQPVAFRDPFPSPEALKKICIGRTRFGYEL